MKRMVTICAIMILSVTAASNVYASNQMTDVLPKMIEIAANDWPEDYEMQDYIVKNQIKAYNNVCRMIKNSRDSKYKETLQKVITRAMVKWTVKTSKGPACDWMMVEYEIKRQLKAYLKMLALRK